MAGLSNQQENWGHSLLYCTALVVLWFHSFMERKQMESLTLGVDKLKSLKKKKNPPGSMWYLDNITP